MSAFPKLKTGAVAQYPAGRSLEHSTEVMRFVDGSEQRYRKRGAAVKRWVIGLTLLDEAEAAAIEAFFEGAQGRFGSFEFQDPWDASVHTNCSFESDEFAMEALGEARARMSLVVRENVS
jgi:hypothetical protein